MATLSSPAAASSPRDDTALNIATDELLLPADDAVASRAPGGSKGAVVDPAVHRFPYCIVWSPIPILTWFLPFIGHMGLADSKGIIFDFAGPYTIGRDDFAFGSATRYLQCTIPPEEAEKWDEAVAAGCRIYEKRMHNLCCDNCHSHVAVCLEHANYAGRKRWNMVQLCFWMFFRGKYHQFDTFDTLKKIKENENGSDEKKRCLTTARVLVRVRLEGRSHHDHRW
ncbi:hypothetical protein PC128_g19242 [Phytophthora cactorum]|nr:hypothetical protein PC120_g9777 [Phytophthora cactorum]KAG3071032.1 hypothetical protein PC121_g9357 [Phytophthora cactorum]KAG3169043.1 hypothetical protein PC128_g19242 [Phytophthora cactorum]KAG4058345.1 hypothetical protein PC123_g6691 [Phytophthora cactorum]